MKPARSPVFDPKKSIFSLPIFWILSGSVVFISSLSTALIIAHSSLSFDFSYEGFNSAIEIFKFPIAFLAMLIPLVALINANHRSEQTKAQILYAESQSTFSNYHKHIEEFEKYLDSHLDASITITSKRDLHFKIYPNARTGDFNIQPDLKKMVFNDVVHCFSFIHPPKTYNENLLDDTVYKLEKLLVPIFDELGIKATNVIRAVSPIQQKLIILKARINALKTIFKYNQGEDFFYLELFSDLETNAIKKLNERNKNAIICFFDMDRNAILVNKMEKEWALNANIKKH